MAPPSGAIPYLEGGEGARSLWSEYIPHASRGVPAEARQGIDLDDTELNNELLRITDAYTDELWPATMSIPSEECSGSEGSQRAYVSGFAPRADIVAACRHVRFVPIGDILCVSSIGGSSGLFRQKVRYRDHVDHGFGLLQQFRHPKILIGHKVDAKLRAELAAVSDDAFAERLAGGIVGRKRPVDIVVIIERFGQRLRLGAGLGDAKAQMRARRGGRVADKHDAAEH